MNSDTGSMRVLDTLPDDISRTLKEMGGGSDRYAQDLVNAYLSRLYDLGWPYRHLSAEYGSTHQTIVNRIKKHRESDDPVSDGKVAELPLAVHRRTVREEPEPAPKRYTLPDSVRGRLGELQEVASRRRKLTPRDSDVVQAADELVRTITEEMEKGATMSSIADAMGVTVATVRNRLGRYGLRRLPPSQQGKILADLR